MQGLAMLHWACDRGHLDVVKFLVNRGADVNIQDPDLQTPLHYGKHIRKLCSNLALSPGSPPPFCYTSEIYLCLSIGEGEPGQL